MPVSIPQLRAAQDALAHLNRGKLAVEVAGPWGSAKTLTAVQIADALRVPLLVLTAGRIESEGVYDDLTTYCGEDSCALLPAWEVLPTDAMDPADDIVAERMHTLQRLTHEMAGGNLMRIAAPVRSLLQHVPKPDTLQQRTLTLRVGDEYDVDDLLLELTKLGYERELMVEQRGQMSMRGCIFDVFPISAELPYRIEFFGDEVESIRRFEPETQRSVGTVDRVDLIPRSEKRLLMDKAAGLAALTDYFPEEALVVVDEPATVAEEARKLAGQFEESPYLMDWAAAHERLEPFRRVNVSQVALGPEGEMPRVAMTTRSLSNWEPPAEDFWGQLELWNVAGYSVHLVANNTGERQRMLELLEEKGYRIDRDAFDLKIELGRLRAGFAVPGQKLAVLSEREVFGRHYVRRRRRRFEAGDAITSLSDLKSGDYVVHAHHGIGRYLGIRRFEGKAGDFLAVQYSKGDKLYLPVTQIDAIQKFTGGDGVLPKVDRLGGATWARTKARVKKAVRDMTEELLKLYAMRESRDGHAFAADTPWQIEFEDAFEYDETPDQLRAIKEVKRDMETRKPMDRLLCGDVGYGKTEVALRAAFKAVQDGRQVALLVPTTVLAEQHYLTFKERLADYPISVDLLCRFRTPKEQKETVEKLKTGEVDIIVGTHRLTSKDIEFKNLGLLVIDEEHRFGVAQKERLKQMRYLVDVLNMTATPIPRTLNLSMLGVRDMSLINTAPNDRLPVHTCIESYDENLIREAIQRELTREGQVFFVHNRVQTITPFADLIQKLVPGARIAIGHGQMADTELEQVMTRFIRHEVDVLVCTTIIGSGIDIPNANTIIINNADQFGLSELYQLRGRVGRYKHRAFAYLLVPAGRALSEDAQKRLKALEDFSTLGAGFRIAMRDLEIRGCGNILGAEQHGHIASVGMDTYSQLVQETVAELKGEPAKQIRLPDFDIAIDAFIPEEFVPSEAQKMSLYRRIANVHTVDEAEEMKEEVADRFGPPPRPVQRLLRIMRLRAQAAELGVSRMTGATSAVCLEFEGGHLLGRRTRTALSQHFGDKLTFAYQATPSVTYKHGGESADDTLDATGRLLQALEEL